jgi:transcriptional regulator with XRE-family HTH domain
VNPKNLKEFFGQRIREERYKRNLTFKELSETTDISPSF